MSRDENFSVKPEFVVRLREPFAELRLKRVRVAQRRRGNFLFDLLRDGVSFLIGEVKSYRKALGKGFVILLDVCLRNAGSH